MYLSSERPASRKAAGQFFGEVVNSTFFSLGPASMSLRRKQAVKGEPSHVL